MPLMPQRFCGITVFNEELRYIMSLQGTCFRMTDCPPLLRPSEFKMISLTSATLIGLNGYTTGTTAYGKVLGPLKNEGNEMAQAVLGAHAVQFVI